MLQHLRGRVEDLQEPPRPPARLAESPEGQWLPGAARDTDVENRPVDRGADTLRQDGRGGGTGSGRPLEIQGRRGRWGIHGGRGGAERLAGHHQGNTGRPAARRHGLSRHDQAEPLCQRDIRVHTQGRAEDDACRMYGTRLCLLDTHLPREPLYRGKGEPQAGASESSAAER